MNQIDCFVFASNDINEKLSGARKINHAPGVISAARSTCKRCLTFLITAAELIVYRQKAPPAEAPPRPNNKFEASEVLAVSSQTFYSLNSSILTETSGSTWVAFNRVVIHRTTTGTCSAFVVILKLWSILKNVLSISWIDRLPLRREMSGQ